LKVRNSGEQNLYYNHSTSTCLWRNGHLESQKLRRAKSILQSFTPHSFSTKHCVKFYPNVTRGPYMVRVMGSEIFYSPSCDTSSVPDLERDCCKKYILQYLLQAYVSTETVDSCQSVTVQIHGSERLAKPTPSLK
jgi:hypothetical protein